MDSAAAWPPLDRASGNLEGQVYQRIRAAILRGDLAPGQRLPSSRALAMSWGVARSTVVNAFDRLKAEGYLAATMGSVTRVTAAGASVFGEAAQPAVITDALPPLVGPGMFGPGLPDVQSFPQREWARALAAAVRRVPVQALGYDSSTVTIELQHAILDHIGASRGVVAAPEQVLLFPSTRMATSLLAELVLSPGDVAWLEDPGYLAARDILLAAGARLLPVPCDGEGMDVARAPVSAPKLIFVTPSHQFPSGVTMSLARRMALLTAAREHSALVLEDDYDSEFRYAGKPIAALQGIDRGERVAYLGTFSKTLVPGLRVAYAVVPRHLLHAASWRQRLRGASVPTHIQAALAGFLREGRFRAHLRRMTPRYAARMTATAAALRRLGGHLWRTGDEAGGLQLAAWFHDRAIDDQALALRLGEAGFAAKPLSGFFLDAPRPGLLLGIADAVPDTVDKAVSRLVDRVEAVLTGRA